MDWVTACSNLLHGIISIRGTELHNILNPDLPTGVICEVKTGNFEDKRLYQEKYLRYSVDRFGFMPDLSTQTDQISENKISTFKFKGGDFQILKLLISHKKSQRSDITQLRIGDIKLFLKRRLKKYIEDKWEDRLFFQCNQLASLIDDVHQKETAIKKT